MVRRLGLGKNNRLTYTSLALNPRDVIMPKKLMFFLFAHKNICCRTHLKRLADALLLSTQNVCFRAEIRQIWSGFATSWISYTNVSVISIGDKSGGGVRSKSSSSKTSSS